jgi:hypothetical protein
MKQLFLLFVLPNFNKIDFKLNVLKENSLNLTNWSLNNYKNPKTTLVLLQDYTNFLNNNYYRRYNDSGYDYTKNENKNDEYKLLYKIHKNTIFLNILNNLCDYNTIEYKLLYVSMFNNYLEYNETMLNNDIKPINTHNGGLYNDWNFEDFSEN